MVELEQRSEKTCVDLGLGLGLELGLLEDRLLVCWVNILLCSMPVMLQDTIEDDRGSPMYHSWER